jgi:DNA-binding XRE family transcriptional regulator
MGAKLKVDEMRRMKKISQAEMAERLHVSLSKYIRMEKYPWKISIEEGMEIADIFGVSFNDIIFMPQKVTNV